MLVLRNATKKQNSKLGIFWLSWLKTGLAFTTDGELIMVRQKRWDLFDPNNVIRINVSAWHCLVLANRLHVILCDRPHSVAIAGRQFRHDNKRGSITSGVALLLERLGMSRDEGCGIVKRFGKVF